MPNSENSAPNSQNSANAWSEGDTNPFAEERAYIDKRQSSSNKSELYEKFEVSADRRFGLGISGGGIRSATFGLGVLQALAHHNKLDRFDYLSTVSGGGYIGSALTWYLSRKDESYGLEKSNFPFGTTDPDQTPKEPENENLKYLRQRGNYLSPGDGITLASGLVVLLRGIAVNLFVWVPLIVALMAFLLLFPGCDIEKGGRICANRPLFAWSIGIGAFLAGVFAIVSLGYSLATYFSGNLDGKPGLQKRYRARRWLERWLPWPLMAMVGLLFVGCIPHIADLLNGYEATGPGAALAGALGGLWSYLKTGAKHAGKIPLAILAPVAAFLFIFGIFVSSFMLAEWLVVSKPTITIISLEIRLYPGVWVVPVLSVVFGLFVNINYMSLHRFYRDRLMEAFMPDMAFIRDRMALTEDSRRRAPAREANSAPIHKLYDRKDPKGPFHIVNTNLVLIGSKDRKRQIRGGDNFIFTPLHCGSEATGWIPTEDYIGGKMTLATAMAISGAAADPHTGVGGVGPTRNRFVSLVMALLDIRLGYWLGNPKKFQGKAPCPNHFRPGFAEMLGLRYSEDDKYIHLSDGGHFENLGLYELIRRRLGVIMICDGGGDLDYSFGDLQTALRRIETDFGTRIDFSPFKYPIEDLIPTVDAGFPVGRKRAERGFAVGKISYADGKTGVLILLKTTMVKGLRLKTRGYQGANPSFPDQSTGDQFFDENQFEAYRELGWRIADQMESELKL